MIWTKRFESQLEMAKAIDRETGLPELIEALQRVLATGDDLFRLAEDSIIHSSDGSWSCKSCGMELDTGGGHSDACCASAILDLATPLHTAEKALAKANPPSTQP